MPLGDTRQLIDKELMGIVGAEHVVTSAEVLERYASDHSLVQPRRPRVAVYPGNTEEIQAIVKYAARTRTPITPRSSAVSFYGAGIPSQGGILMDLRRLNRILEIDPKDRKVKVEPGVTWAEVQATLEGQGMMVCCPLLPHRDKSVLTSAMEREPILITKSEYNETFLTAEIVIGNGELFWMGTALAKGMVGQNNPEAFILGTRLFRGHQGTLGIVTWANIKAEFIPRMDKLFFIPFDKIEAVADPVYRIQRLMLGGECFVLNNFNLASILAQRGVGQFETLREALPPYTIVLCLSGLRRRPEGRLEYEEEALMKAAGELGFEPKTTLAGIKGAPEVVLKMLRKPWPGDDYWKFYPKGASSEIFFHSTLNRAQEFNQAISAIAARYGYPAGDIGIYLQPIERARICHYQFSFYYHPDNERDRERVRALFLEASQKVTDMGGLFTTPYGPWAEMVFSRAATYTRVMRTVKAAFDPDNIMNPGKLCF